eukprot:Phypoly_transcript_13197.p1 GENE.Phypoly_transcript_13197~~Phypoly_transcript_13197.p1  ORF type:complete len:170 (+),score=39.09 Phypoly_transcript_13197:124-633(+)
MGGGMQAEGITTEEDLIQAIKVMKDSLDKALNSAKPALAAQIASEIALLQGRLQETQGNRLRDESIKKKLATISVAIDTINSEINRLRGEIKNGFSRDAFDTPKWLQQAQQFNQRLEKQIFELDSFVDIGEELKAERKVQVVRISQYHEVVDQLIVHLNNSNAFLSWLT